MTRDRRKIRENLRKAAERAKGPPPPAPPERFEVACVCGQLLRLTEAHDEKRCSCPACGRKFLMTFTVDQGRKIGCPMYLEDATPTGETLIVEAPGAVSRAKKGKGGMDDALGPPPPPDLVCVCPACASRMRVKQAFYDKRAKCPRCPARLLLTVVYDPASKRHSIQPLRVTDAPSGETRPFEF